MAIIPNGVELPADNQTLSRPAFLNGDDRKLLLFLGRIHPKKGIVETLDAWSRVLRARPATGRDWTLVIAGWDDGNHMEGVEAYAASLGLHGHVHFPGPLFGADKQAALMNASAFVLASYSEGLPMAVLEAWAHRTPVFMTAACNLPEGFNVGAAIQISTAPATMAQVFLDHLDDRGLPQMGMAGRILVQKLFYLGPSGRRALGSLSLASPRRSSASMRPNVIKDVVIDILKSAGVNSVSACKGGVVDRATT